MGVQTAAFGWATIQALVGAARPRLPTGVVAVSAANTAGAWPQAPAAFLSESPPYLALRGVETRRRACHRGSVLVSSTSAARAGLGLRGRRPPGGLVVPFAAAAAALVLATTTHLVDFGVYDLRIAVLNSADEHSYSHWLATLAFAAGALAAGVGARRAASHRIAWWSSCVVFGFLFVDTVFRVHDHVGFWPVLYAPLLVGLAVALAVVASGTDQAVVVYAGLGLLFVSLGIHVVGPSVVHALGWAPAGWGYQVKVALKEGSELAGWVLLVPALARLASRR